MDNMIRCPLTANCQRHNCHNSFPRKGAIINQWKKVHFLFLEFTFSKTSETEVQKIVDFRATVSISNIWNATFAFVFHFVSFFLFILFSFFYFCHFPLLFMLISLPRAVPIHFYHRRYTRLHCLSLLHIASITGSHVLSRFRKWKSGPNICNTIYNMYFI